MKKDISVTQGEPVAIIGASCRFPGGVTDIDSFWRLLESGTDAVTTLPPDRFSIPRYCSAAGALAGHSYTSAAGIIDHIKEFDPDFFGISRKEALDMDLQQRLVLETVWEAFERAHIVPSTLRGGDVGVFIGASSTDNSLQAPDDPAGTSPYSMTGNTLSVIANRVSWFFDLRGPSMVIDTACSSSLIAVHTACEALRGGDIPLAIAGGVNILLVPYPFIGFSMARMLSPDGRCKVFDASANGYVRSEGAGIVLLKPLGAAQRDGDIVLGCIAASGVNSDGRTNGLALPNGQAQSALLRRIYADSGLDPAKLVYVEAHGTGTAAGDPIEAGAIGEVLGKALHGVRTLPVGSVKGNIGHLEPASGMAGLLKALLVLRHGKIPPQLHLKNFNPSIDFASLNLRVPRNGLRLPKAGGAELAGVNSFGFGGANAHVVLQRAQRTRAPKIAQKRGDPLPPLFLSANSAHSLRSLAGMYAERLEGASPQLCYDTAATLAFERESLPLRAVVAGESVADVRAALKRLADGSDAENEPSARKRARTERKDGVFVFSGNGGHWVGMGAGLMARNADFRRTIEAVDSLMTPLLGWSLADAFRSADRQTLDLTEIVQPMLFALQAGLVAALRGKGLTPSAVIGHSVGEVAAAWACGALSMRDAVTVIYHRSRLQAKTRDAGGMAVVSLSVENLRAMLDDIGANIAVAAVNSAASLTVAGDNDALGALLEECANRRIAAKKLSLPYPFHTKFMDGIQQELLRSLRGIRPRKPRIPFLSTVSGVAGRIVANAGYWWRNLREPTLFKQAVESAYGAGFRHFLEIGPAPVLHPYLRDILHAGPRESVSIGRTLVRNRDDVKEFEQAWRKAWRNGWLVDAKMHFPKPYVRRPLPDYPWDREYLWPEVTSEGRGFLRAGRVHPLLGWRLPGKAPLFENVLHTADFPWIADHRIGNGVVYPAAAFVESMLAAACALHNDARATLERVVIFKPLALDDRPARAMRLSVDMEDGGLIVESRPYMSAEAWSVCARARIPRAADYEAEALPLFAVDSAGTFGARVEGKTLYAIADHFHAHYGPAFRTVECAFVRSDAPEVLVRFGGTDRTDRTGVEGMLIPPAMLDGALQSLFILLDKRAGKNARAYLPVSFERVTLLAQGVPRYAHARLERFGLRSAVASFSLLDARGAVLLALEKCRFHRAAWLERDSAPSRPYQTTLMPLPHPDEVRPLDAVLSVSLTPEAAQTLAREVRARELLRLATFACAHETSLAHSATPAEQRDPSREIWMQGLTERLAAAGLAAYDNGRPVIHPLGERPDARTLWRTLLANAPAYLPEAALLAHVFEHHGDILPETGEAREDLPERLKERYFADSPALRPHAAAALRCLQALLDNAGKGQTLDILCIGRHMPALLPDVLALLNGTPHRLTVAARDSAGVEALTLASGVAPGLRFTALDPENPDKDHLAAYQYILFAWSLHEHLNSDRALEGCREMLAPGGLLCLLEREPDIFTDYVFGASPSYWTSSPESGLPASLLQHTDFWRAALERVGFADITEPGNDAETASLPVCLLLGRRPAAMSGAVPDMPREAETNAGARWLVVAGDDDRTHAPAAALHDALRDRGETVVLLRGAVIEAGWWKTTLAEQARHAGNHCLHVVFLGGYDNRGDITLTALDAVQRVGTTALAALAAAWDALRADMRLWVVTGGALSDDNVPGLRPVPSQGALSGFARVLMNEMRAFRTTLLDVHGDFSAAPLVRELTRPTDEPEVVFAAGARHVPRLTRLSRVEDNAPGHDGAVLTIDAPGRLRNLYWQSASVPDPAPDGVCVAVSCAGLNFRDVMFSTGMLPDEALENGFSGPTMGMECSGVIVAAGRNVSGWKAGDEVVCFAPAALASHVVTKASAVARKPANISFAEAATLPVAFMTAWYSLKHLARLRPGERVLIHGAAGGVGLAALQVAVHLGLEVYATAGAPEKHSFLRGLGVRHIFSSRSLAFARQVLDATGGQGVDAVLNSIAGEAVPAGLSVLRPFGRFIELGKRDIYADAPLRLRPFSNNLSWFGVDVDQLLLHEPDLAQKLFAELMDLFAQGKLMPLPHTVWPATRCVDAFEAMQRSAHMGKLVISLKDAVRAARPRLREQRRMRCRPDATYLVSGGAGGLGLATAARLAERGAKHLLLVSRSGVRRGEPERVVAALRENGVQVVEVRADVADARKLRRALTRSLKTMPPLRGIVHAAAVLDDGVITSLTPERIANSLAAKSLGAFNLHMLSLPCDLDFFALYSSATTPFGNPGQAGYVAANCMLESLAAWRRARQLPAQVIGWGPIADTGMLTRNPKAREMLVKILGVSPTRSAEALDWLEHCLAGNIGASHFFGLDWQSGAELAALAAPRFRHLRPALPPDSACAALSPEDVRTLPPEEGLAFVTDALMDEISRVLRLPKDRFAPDDPLASLGMDSLMAVELSLAVEQKFALSGFTLSLSEQATARSLAAALYAAIVGENPDRGDDAELLRDLARRHGHDLSARDPVRRELEGVAHA
jgi:acyl transferase domain-containing protein/NADPH:quinone reductase-like Zn-dependent oxidoreductase/acyl carrier protein